MNKSIQLHDCELAKLTFSDCSTIILFSPAYVHESLGTPDSTRAWAGLRSRHSRSRTRLALPFRQSFRYGCWTVSSALETPSTRPSFPPAVSLKEQSSYFSLCLRRT